MDVLMKAGEWPNIAMEPGTRKHAVTGEPVEVPMVTMARCGCDDVWELENGRITAIVSDGVRYVKEGR